MTRAEFDAERSWGRFPCPDCGTFSTHPYPNCGCPPNDKDYGTKHINKWHHTCPIKPPEVRLPFPRLTGDDR